MSGIICNPEDDGSPHSYSPLWLQFSLFRILWRLLFLKTLSFLPIFMLVILFFLWVIIYHWVWWPHELFSKYHTKYNYLKSIIIIWPYPEHWIQTFNFIMPQWWASSNCVQKWTRYLYCCFNSLNDVSLVLVTHNSIYRNTSTSMHLILKY